MLKTTTSNVSALSLEYIHVHRGMNTEGPMMHARSLLATTLLAVAMFTASEAHAGALNPWGPPAGKATLTVNPYVFVSKSSVLVPLYLSVGITDRVDVIVGGFAEFADGEIYAGPEIMPRVFVTDNIGFALYFSTWGPNGGEYILGPAMHALWSVGSFDIAMNLTWMPLLSQGELDAGDVQLLLGPEYYFNDRISAYIEFNPTMTLQELGASVDIVPGIGLLLGPEGSHALSIGTIVPIEKAPQPTVGAWYAYTFGFSKH